MSSGSVRHLLQRHLSAIRVGVRDEVNVVRVLLRVRRGNSYDWDRSMKKSTLSSLRLLDYTTSSGVGSHPRAPPTTNKKYGNRRSASAIVAVASSVQHQRKHRCSAQVMISKCCRALAHLIVVDNALVLRMRILNTADG